MIRPALRPAAIGLFADADSLLAAARTLRAEEIGHIETISPVPLHGVEEALENRKTLGQTGVSTGGHPSLSRVFRKGRGVHRGTPKPVPDSQTSPVRYYTLAGALLGFVTGWSLTAGSALHYPLIVGGKPLLSLTPFGVIAYICTILFGALFTVAGMLLHAGLPRFGLAGGYDSRLTGNRFGLLVACERERLEEVGRRLLELGAEEVKHVAV